MSESQNKSSRRGFMLGAAVAGATTAAAVATLPESPVAETPVVETPPAPPENGGGYRVTEHVRRYYKTTLV